MDVPILGIGFGHRFRVSVSDFGFRFDLRLGPRAVCREPFHISGMSFGYEFRVMNFGYEFWALVSVRSLGFRVPGFGFRVSPRVGPTGGR